MNMVFSGEVRTGVTTMVGTCCYGGVMWANDIPWFTFVLLHDGTWVVYDMLGR